VAVAAREPAALTGHGQGPRSTGPHNDRVDDLASIRRDRTEPVVVVVQAVPERRRDAIGGGQPGKAHAPRSRGRVEDHGSVQPPVFKASDGQDGV